LDVGERREGDFRPMLSPRTRRCTVKAIFASMVALLTLATAVEAAGSGRPVGPPPVVGTPEPASQWAVPLSQESVGLLSTCSVGYRYAGYQYVNIPPNGGAMSAGVKWNTTTLYPGGHVSGWVGVSNNAATKWIQAGLVRYQGGGSIRKYIEYTGDDGYDLVDMGTASAGSVYFAVVTKLGGGWWTASIGGSGLGSNVNITNLHKTDFTGESYQGSGGNCNVMDINFTNSSKPIASMDQLVFAPYMVVPIPPSAWRSHGG
jgi:hypothetical protein